MAVHTRRTARGTWLARFAALGVACMSLGPCTETLVTSTIDGAFAGLTRQLVEESRANLGLTPTPGPNAPPTSSP